MEHLIEKIHLVLCQRKLNVEKPRLKGNQLHKGHPSVVTIFTYNITNLSSIQQHVTISLFLLSYFICYPVSVILYISSICYSLNANLYYILKSRFSCLAFTRALNCKLHFSTLKHNCNSILPT